MTGRKLIYLNKNAMEKNSKEIYYINLFTKLTTHKILKTIKLSQT